MRMPKAMQEAETRFGVGSPRTRIVRKFYHGSVWTGRYRGLNELTFTQIAELAEQRCKDCQQCYVLVDGYQFGHASYCEDYREE